jgi:hypothetical protein
MAGELDALLNWYLKRRKGTFQTFTVGTTAAIVLPPDPYRRSLLVSNPGPGGVGGSNSVYSNTQFGLNQSTTTVDDVIVQYTVPTGKSALVTSAGWTNITGTAPTIQGWILQSAGHEWNTTGTVAPNTILQVNTALAAANSFYLLVSVVGTGTAAGFVGVLEYGATSSAGSNIYLSFGLQGAANQGIVIPPSVQAREFHWERYGDVLCKDIWAIADAASTPLTIIAGRD